MSKITQARARADRRELKAVKAKLYRYTESVWPGIHLRNIGIVPEATLVLKTATKLRSDLVFRFEPDSNQLVAYAVRRS